MDTVQTVGVEQIYSVRGQDEMLKGFIYIYLYTENNL